MSQDTQVSTVTEASQDTISPQVSMATEAPQDTISVIKVALEEPSQAQTAESASTSTFQPAVAEPVAAAQDVVSSFPPQQVTASGVGVVHPHPLPMEMLSSSEELEPPFQPAAVAQGSALVTSQVAITSSESEMEHQNSSPAVQTLVLSADAQETLSSDAQAPSSDVPTFDIQQFLSSEVISSGVPQSGPSAVQQATPSGHMIPQPEEGTPVPSPAPASGADSSESLLGKPSEAQPISAGVVTFAVEGMDQDALRGGDIEDVSDEEGGDRMEEGEEDEEVGGTEGQEEAIMEVADTTQTEGELISLWNGYQVRSS